MSRLGGGRRVPGIFAHVVLLSLDVLVKILMGVEGLRTLATLERLSSRKRFLTTNGLLLFSHRGHRSALRKLLELLLPVASLFCMLVEKFRFFEGGAAGVALIVLPAPSYRFVGKSFR